MLVLPAAAVAGFLLACGVLLWLQRRGARRSPGPSAFGSASAALALAALLASALGYFLDPGYLATLRAQAATGRLDLQGVYAVAAVTGLGAAVLAALALFRGDRYWRAVLGLLIGFATLGIVLELGVEVAASYF